MRFRADTTIMVISFRRGFVVELVEEAPLEWSGDDEHHRCCDLSVLRTVLL